MRGWGAGTAVLIGAGAVLASAALPAAAVEKAPVERSRAVVVVDCARNPQVRPGSYMIACGDGNNALASLHWSQWNRSGAVGAGRNLVNDCIPACSSGHFHSYPVSVRLDRARPWAGHHGRSHFTRLSVTYTSARPPHAPRTETFDV
ncbi:hypothetical protein GCM10010357_39560 [Streptomyces luteireticuli]|uniref:Secreted protein n=1 Tax=Streptomyces luteireticuli TaxID=173858 RepID=A0ABN0YW09_9ACTN